MDFGPSGPAARRKWGGMADSEFATSASLLERLRSGATADDWGRFVSLYTPLLLRWSRRAGVADADDVVQETLVALVGALPQFVYDPTRKFRNWLYTIWLNKVRERHRRARRATVEVPVDEYATPDGLERWIDETYARDLVQRLAELLRDQYAESTWRAFWETTAHDRPAAAVADELRMSVDAVYQAKLRILRRLRAELAGLLDSDVVLGA